VTVSVLLVSARACSAAPLHQLAAYILCLLTMEWRALEQKGDGPGPRSSHTLVATDDALYVFGGELEPRVPVDNVLYKYSLASSSWEQVQASGTAPSARNAPTAALVGSTICKQLLGNTMIPAVHTRSHDANNGQLNTPTRVPLRSLLVVVYHTSILTLFCAVQKVSCNCSAKERQP
jgi:Galactose oxidase, central domain